jgi:UDP-sulfoquinovose synthase
MRIPEGYLRVKVEVDGEEKEIDIMYPPNPGSIYHMTKTQDALCFLYYNKNDELRITDLHQGIVWGTLTEESALDEALINRFDYDGDYGTVLNRFLIQAAVGHPLTVHGTGGQTRAFINIQDTVQCIRLAIENPPDIGEPVKIFNQTTETHNVLQLAKKIAEMTGAEIRYYVNPRNEDDRNELRFATTGFVKLGLKPITLSDGLLGEIHEVAAKYKDRCDMEKIICTSRWRNDIPEDKTGSENPVSKPKTKQTEKKFSIIGEK